MIKSAKEKADLEYLVEFLNEEGKNRFYEDYVVIVNGKAKTEQQMKPPKHCIGTVTMMAICF